MTFNLFAKCTCHDGVICQYCWSLTAVAFFMVYGAFVAWKPRKVIDLQIAFYRMINWKMEPISMEKEIRNTRVMGLIVVILGAFSLIYLIVK